MIIEKGTSADIDELEILYDNLNDYLDKNINYPGWLKGIYPVRETAVQGIAEDSLFVLRIDNTIAGSIILNNTPESAYNQVRWGIDADYDNILVIRTLVVNPLFLKKGIASHLMNYAKEYAQSKNMKALRLDVSVNNTPAIALYRKLGYRETGTVDLGLNYQHLIWFKLFELLL